MLHDSNGTSPSRSQLDVMKAQVQAIDAWTRAHHLNEAAAQTVGMTREMRLDLRRRLEARRREQAAIAARADAQLRSGGELLNGGCLRTRAVVAHRNAWMREKVTTLLVAGGVDVVGVFDDGADAAGTVVAEQPELVMLEDRLPTLSGIDVVRRVRDYSPLSVVGAQALDSEGVAPLVDAGAHAVFTRRIPAADMVDQLLACLRGDVRSHRALTLV